MILLTDELRAQLLANGLQRNSPRCPGSGSLQGAHVMVQHDSRPVQSLAEVDAVRTTSATASGWVVD